MTGPITYGQVRAGFSADAVAGCAPLAVQFQDASSGSPVTWKWDLGNGTTSLFQNPSTVYFAPGVYTVKLVVTNSTGSDSVIRQQYITVYGTPRPDFTASDTTGCFPLQVQFTDLTTTADIHNPVTLWRWDFGDGDTSRLSNPKHTYSNAGNFTITLQVVSDKGCIQSAGKKQYIRIASGVKAGFTDTADKSCQAPVKVSFFNQSAGPGTLTYNWDFGDGSFSNLASPVHLYTSNGTYTARLVTTSDAGCRDTLVKPALFNIGSIKVLFASPDSVCTGEVVPAVNGSTPLPPSVKWDFGDGTLSTQQEPLKSYTVPGAYTIKLVDIFQNCMDSAERQIQVMSRPTVAFTSGDLYSCSVPFTAHFTSNAVPGTVCRWDFGDGNQLTTDGGAHPNQAHTYTSFGLFTVRLVMTGAGGCQDTMIRSSYIRVQAPQINITGLPARGCLPLIISPVANSQIADSIVAYHWDFGDGTGSTLMAPQKTYVKEGDYTVKLVIRTAGGCVDTVIIPHAVSVSTKPLVKFSADPLDACRSVQVRFTNLSIPAGDTWKWDFSDGGISSLPDPAHQFADTGYFTVSLVVWNKACADTLSKVHLVHIDPPLAQFAVSQNCADKYTRTFTDHSIGAQHLRWDFGDGGTSTDPTAIHRYTKRGRYRMKLVVTNDVCVDSAIRIIIIADEHPRFQAAVTELCKGSPVAFTLSGFDPSYMVTILWDFGDGTTSPVAGDVTHVYTRAGRHTVSLRTMDVNDCRDTFSIPQYIRVNGPTADFETPQKVCVNSKVGWKDRSLSDSEHAIIRWVWDYGDGMVQAYSSPPFQHVYAGGGNYTVGLTITDAYGCVDSLKKGAAILVADPRAAFASSDTNTCPGKTIVFSNTSTGGRLLYQWDFGNGLRLPAAGPGVSPVSPVYAYPLPGTFQVGLLVKDTLGCRDSVVHVVRISLPVAGFALSDSMGSCPPLQVQFTNRSANYNSLQWDFGDGSFSTLENPVHFYNFPGTYFSKVLIRGPGGCEDSMIRKIVVRGPQGSFSYSPLTGCRPLTVQLKAAIRDKESLFWDFNDGGTSATGNTTTNYTYGLAGRFLPRMILIDSAGCKVAYTGADTIRVIGVSCLAGMDAYRVCDSGFIQFADHSVANDYIARQEWRFGDGGGPPAVETTDLSANPRHYYDTTGVFTVWHKVTTEKGCMDSTSLVDTIKVYRSPGAAINGDSAACTPGSLLFRSGPVTGDPSLLSWKWDFGNGQTTNAPDPGRQLYSTPGSYTVQLQVTYAAYCSSAASRNVNIWPLPNTFAGNDTFVCQGHPVQLQAMGADSFVWNPAPVVSCMKCADPWIDPATDTVYTVTGTTVKGCVKEDSVKVRVRHPFTLKIQSGGNICLGQSISVGAAGADQYQWIPATGLVDPDSSVTRASPVATTDYTVIGSDNDHCFTDSAKVLITVYPIPEVFAGNDTTVIAGSTLQLHTTNSADIDQWNWQPVAGLSCSTCSDPKAAITKTITYRVSVANAGGCTSSDDITIHSVCDNNNWFVPNTFSPNGDGMNDVFYIRGKGLNTVQSIIIFNRWGQVVFEKRNFAPNDPSAGWDGTFQGRKAPMDMYVYYIEIICDNSTVIPYRGNVTLIR